MDGGRLFLQLLRITAGFICAVLIAGVFLAFGFFRETMPEDDPVAFAAALGTGLVTGSLIGGGAFVPACLAILVAEIGRFRSFIYHLGAGGLIALVLWTLDAAPGQVTDIRPGTTIALSAGFLAGAAYWLIAGRNSGNWRG